MTIDRQRLSQIDSELQSLSDMLGVEMERQILKDNDSFEVALRLADLPQPIGFSILIADDYFNWHVELKLDHFSDGLIRFMRKSLRERMKEIENLIEKTRVNNSRFHLEIDGTSNLLEIANKDWWDFSLEIARNYQSEADTMKALNELLFDFICLLLLLLSVNVHWVNSSENEAREEGATKLTQSNRYERSRINRAICLRHHGFRCHGCGALLQEKYGPLGTNVIHVHHIIPVSKMGGSYVLDPIKDLVPLCPNCHNVVHRQDPPLSIANLRAVTNYEPSKINKLRN